MEDKQEKKNSVININIYKIGLPLQNRKSLRKWFIRNNFPGNYLIFNSLGKNHPHRRVSCDKKSLPG